MLYTRPIDSQRDELVSSINGPPNESWFNTFSQPSQELPLSRLSSISVIDWKVDILGLWNTTRYHLFDRLA